MSEKIIDIKNRVNAKRAEEQKQFSPETEQPKPLFSWQGIGRFLDNAPKPQEFIFENLLPSKVVGAIFATGGIGKTTLALQLSACLATGTDFGPFKPVKPAKVLFIGGEDAEDIFHRRLYKSIPAMGMKGNPKETLLRSNLEVVSLVGSDRFLTALDERGNPKTTEVFRSLQETIKAIPDLELVIIDPKSRFDGLNENDNSHATFFISCLEKLVSDHGVTVLFSHHESKAQVKDGEVRASSGRGASALRDGVRWALSLGEMGQKEAEKFEVNSSDYIEAAISKNNYGPKWGNTQYFQRDNDGVLSPANLHTQRADALCDELVKELVSSSHIFTATELETRSNDKDRTAAAKAISNRLDEQFSGYKRGVDMRRAIEQAKFRGRLMETEVMAGKILKKVLVVPDHVRAQFPSDLAINDLKNDLENEPLQTQAKKGKK